MKQILFIYNPVAGVGKIKHNMFEVIEFYNENDCLVTLCPVRKMEDWYRTSPPDIVQYDRIVCCGGDGTLNIVVSFLKQHDSVCNIAYIPAGSTNDFAYSLGIPEDFDRALGTTLFGALRKIDTGNFNGRHFLYVAAFGLFTQVAYNTSQKAKNLLGHVAYILNGIRQLSELKTYKIEAMINGTLIKGEFILGLITNSFSIGGFKKLMPDDVSLEDGEFEVMLIKMPTSIAALHSIAASLFLEKFNSNEYIMYYKASKIEIISQEEIDWTLDGEYGGKTSTALIENVPESLSIYV